MFIAGDTGTLLRCEHSMAGSDVPECRSVDTGLTQDLLAATSEPPTFYGPEGVTYSALPPSAVIWRRQVVDPSIDFQAVARTGQRALADGSFETLSDVAVGQGGEIVMLPRFRGGVAKTYRLGITFRAISVGPVDAFLTGDGGAIVHGVLLGAQVPLIVAK
jgi:hypothetical protein